MVRGLSRRERRAAMKAFDEDLVSGSILRSVWKIAWPLVTLNMVNGLHAIIDHAMVGHFVSSPENAANAGIGVAWQVFLVVVVLISSLYHGMNIYVARYAGQKDRDRMNRVAYDTFLTSIYVLVFVAAPLGYVLAPWVLQAARPEPVVMQYALPYIRVLFLCGAPIFLMFMLTGAMQASGDPRTPLLLGVLTTTLNVVLSYLLITGAGPFPELGATGAALATCLAPVVSVGIALRLLAGGGTIISAPSKLTFVPDLRIMKPVVRLGAWTGAQAVLLNLGGLLLLRFVGGLENSAAAQATYTICYAQLFSFVAWPSWALRNAASTIVGQNVGAGDVARGKRGVYVAAGLGLAWAAFMGTLFWAIPMPLLALFEATDEPVLTYGTNFLRFLAFSGLFLTAALALTGGLIGSGDTRSPFIIAFLTQIVVLLGICAVAEALGMLSTSVIWAAILTSHFARLLLTAGVFYRTRLSYVSLSID
jgi:putative MATE family efflux protein